MNTNELTAAYVLDELDGPRLADFERRLAADPGLRAEVEALRGTMAQLEALPADAWPGGETAAADATSVGADFIGSPDDSSLAAAPGLIGDDAARGGRRHAGTRRLEGGRRSLSLRPALAAALIAAVFVFGGAAGALIFSADGGSSSPTPHTLFVLHPLDAPAGSRADISMPDAETMLLRARGLPASPAGTYYEVWLMSSPRKLVPVASFRVGASGAASVEVPLPASPADYRYFDVSRQTVSGGTGHSADSVLRGATGGTS